MLYKGVQGQSPSTWLGALARDQAPQAVAQAQARSPTDVTLSQGIGVHRLQGRAYSVHGDPPSPTPTPPLSARGLVGYYPNISHGRLFVPTCQRLLVFGV